MINPRTEKAIKEVISKGWDCVGVVIHKDSGNHTIEFSNRTNRERVARFTLRSIIGKRLKKRKARK